MRHLSLMNIVTVSVIHFLISNKGCVLPVITLMGMHDASQRLMRTSKK